jgi:N-acetylmuramoyl-L-alanine amidase
LAVLCLTVLPVVFGSAGCTTYLPDTPNITARRIITPQSTPTSIPPRKPVLPPMIESQPSSVEPFIGPVTIVIDPGHGGKDPGTQDTSRVPEKHIVLAIALELAQLLTDRGANVVMTRSTDRFIELADRAAIAERRKADLFVSIHADFSRNLDASGATVLTGRTASEQSKRAAWKIKTSLQRAGIACRKTRPQRLTVLEDHSRPAVLVECGFLSHRTEAANLNTSWYQSKIAQAIAEGISDYFLR